MLMPFATRPAQPMYCRLTPAVQDPCFSWPVSSSAPTVMPRAGGTARAAASSPAAAYLLTWLIAAASPTTPGSAAAAPYPATGPRLLAIVHPFR